MLSCFLSLSTHNAAHVVNMRCVRRERFATTASNGYPENMRRVLLACAIPLAFSACATLPAPSAHSQFMANIAQHCGTAYAGKIVANTPASSTPDPFEGKTLVMHVRGCTDPQNRLEIPFHVGDDHSRTWIITRQPTGLRLKHDHRHKDGTPDDMTMYGGDTRTDGTANRQEFPVDQESIAMFQKGGLNASVENTWAMEIHDKTFVYELSRPNGRLFKVEFDTTKPVPLPPNPWGW